MIERLAAYLAADRLEALAEGRELPDRATGAALSVDLAGFSAFADALVRRAGPREGAEELTRQLNAVYDGLIACVGGFAGAIVGFAGDGFTAWFDDARAPAAARAVACGLAQQESFRDWAAAEAGRTALALRVAVVSGPVRRFAVGDPSQQRLDVLAGETMVRLAAADAAAAKGELVVDAATRAALGARLLVADARADEQGREVLAVRELDGGVALPPPFAGPAGLDARALRPWLLGPVFERLSAGRADFLSELRPAAALFVGFEGIDYDGGPRAAEELDAFVRRVQGIVARYEGSLLQLTIGDKGSYLYVALGAPLGHADDAFRAVRAAVRLSRAAEAPVHSLRVGASHGLVRVGAYGGAARRTYGVLGDEVNLAARLMQKARPGTPLFSERLRDATRDKVRWEELPALRVKGREQPVPVFRALGAAEASAPAAPVVGRDDERTALLWAVEAAVAGGAVVVEAVAGLGKSRLVDEAAAQAAAFGLRVLAGAGDEIERHEPYHGWRAAFAALLELGGPDGLGAGRTIAHTIGLNASQTRLRPGGPARQRPELEEEAAARVRALVARAAGGSDALAPLVSAVLPREIPQNERTRPLVPLVRAARTLELLAALLREAAAERPLVVVLEDAQWLDSASWALAVRAAELPGLLLLVALRPFDGAPPAEYVQLGSLPRTRNVPLGPLDPESLDAVAAQALDAARLAAPLAAALRERAEGSPLVALELVRALREGSLVEVVDGEARPASSSAASALRALPHTLEGVVLGRLDRLPALAQRVLKLGAVIGPQFGWGCLRQVFESVEGRGADVRGLPPALLQLERAGLVEAVRGGAEPSWSFRSTFVHDVVYNVMGSDQRRELHRALAGWLEEVAGQDPSEQGVLAHHWLRAGQLAQARPYLERAAEGALRAGAWGEAARLYTTLLDAEEGQAQDEAGRLRRAAWESELGAALAGGGRLPEARRRLEQALERLGRPTGPALARAALGAGARDLLRRLAPWRPARAADPALVQAAVAYERLAELHWLSDAPLPALSEALRGLQLALRTGQEGVRARLQAAVALAIETVPLPRPGSRLMASAVAAARRAGDPGTLSWVLELSALEAFALGRWKDTAARLDEALAGAEAAGDRRRSLELRSLRGWALLTRGDLRRAVAALGPVEHDASAEGDPRTRAAARLGLAIAALRQGEAARSLALVRGRRAAALLPLAHALLGEPREALLLLPAAVAQARPRPFKCWGMERYTMPAEAAVFLLETAPGLPPGEREALQALALEAVASAARFARVFPIGAPRLALLRGELAWLAGRRAQARASWTLALGAARRLDMPLDEARVALRLGRLVATDAGEREALLGRAAALLEELGTAEDSLSGGA